MGQIAEDMTDGTCCDICGCYFQESLEAEEFTRMGTLQPVGIVGTLCYLKKIESIIRSLK